MKWQAPHRIDPALALLDLGFQVEVVYKRPQSIFLHIRVSMSTYIDVCDVSSRKSSGRTACLRAVDTIFSIICIIWVRITS
jgi:hypothetical protein